MVAPISVSRPSSTAGSSASCWALLKRWISSRKRIVARPFAARRSRARSITARISARPALTADSSSKAPSAPAAAIRASVVFPAPGRPVEDRAVRPALFDRRAQRRAPTQDVLLPDQLVQRSAAACAPPAARRQPASDGSGTTGIARDRIAARPPRRSMREAGRPPQPPRRCGSGRRLSPTPHNLPVQSSRWRAPPRSRPSLPAPSSRSIRPPASWSARCRRSRPEQVQAVVDDVARVQPAWGELPAKTRATYMRRAADALLDEIDEIAELLVREQGKPRTEAYTMELLPTVDALHWCAKAGPKILADEKVRMTQAFTLTKSGHFSYRADRRRRRDRALELPLVDPLRRGRDRADGRQRRRPQAGQPDAPAGRADPRASSSAAACPRAWSGSSTAAARSARRSPARASARSSSPARSRSGARSARSAPPRSRAPCSSSAARTR